MSLKEARDTYWTFITDTKNRILKGDTLEKDLRENSDFMKRVDENASKYGAQILYAKPGDLTEQDIMYIESIHHVNPIITVCLCVKLGKTPQELTFKDYYMELPGHEIYKDPVEQLVELRTKFWTPSKTITQNDIKQITIDYVNVMDIVPAAALTDFDMNFMDLCINFAKVLKSVKNEPGEQDQEAPSG